MKQEMQHSLLPHAKAVQQTATRLAELFSKCCKKKKIKEIFNCHKNYLHMSVCNIQEPSNFKQTCDVMMLLLLLVMMMMMMITNDSLSPSMLKKFSNKEMLKVVAREMNKFLINLSKNICKINTAHESGENIDN